MTLATRADHAFGDECSRVAGEAEVDVVPEARAEEYVMEIEGTEDDPVTIDDPKHRARELADDVRDDAEDAAGLYTESSSVAESVAEEFASNAFEAVLEELRAVPTVEIVGGDA